MRGLCFALIANSLLLAVDRNDLSLAKGQTPSFNQVVAGMKPLRDFEFGTRAERNVRSIVDLAKYFCVYGISGTENINQEWDVYPGGGSGACGTFNTTNWVFTEHSLQLKATLNGALRKGNISTGQITSIDTFCPSASTNGKCGSDTWGSTAYAFEIEMQFPARIGAWPAFWLYTKDGDKKGNCGTDNSCSELDIVEFLVESGKPPNQDQHDATFDSHGPPGMIPASVGTPTYSALSRYNTYSNGTDWSRAHHKYQAYWTTDYRYTYLDGVLLQAVPFTWYADGPAQFIANLAFGTSAIRGMAPTSQQEFPAVMDVTHIKVWGK